MAQRFRPLMFLAFLASIGVVPSAVAQAPEPPIWVVRDDDSTVYMVGTVHMMREGVAWQSTAVADVLAEADELWLEIPDLTPPDNLGGMIMRLGFSPDQPLSSRLSAEELAGLEAILDEHQIPLESFDSLRPWFAYLQITSLVMLDAGFDPQSGIDVQIKAQAEAQGMPVYGFETFDEQFDLLSGMPDKVQLEVLRQTIADYEESQAELVEQLEGWIGGDLGVLEEGTAEIAAELPEFYEALFVERNVGFVDGIEEILAGSGTALVAVGLGHYVGPDSIPAMLEARGYTVERR
ncbi:TraB/GumN family protein [Pelagibacterium lacus]|uniref:TraB/GumN family protein n=1 Tax=Pelagibacterium lacus TaxID=2282655 RepID=A0A369W7K5_9HYPH|nr:TraB/GumN family protein [Pelagibacterium lacus]RDE10313.1 TraB/GumN family protein [Pelagibacterium lacus]